jgi:hypothetical protein
MHVHKCAKGERAMTFNSPRFFSIVMVLVLSCAAISTGGCAADIDSNNEQGEPAQAYSLTIWNRSQFPIKSLELVGVPARLSTDGSIMTEAVDSMPVWREGEPALQMEQTFVVQGFVSGSRVSFQRERAAGAMPIEVMSVEGFVLDQDGYTLVLFDDSFRLLYPWSEENPNGASRVQ